jgi:hypothetical protein
MPSNLTPLVSRQRLGSALVVAVLTAAFNYGSEVTTPADVAVWLAIGIAVAYLVFTAMGLAGDRIWPES